MRREAFERQFCATGAPSGLLKASLCYGQPTVGPTPGFAANRAVAIEVVLKFRQNPVLVQNRESTRVAKPRGPLEEESVPRKPLEEDPVLRAPGRLQKSIWTPGRHQAGKDLWTAWGGTREAPANRKGPFGQPARHQGGIWDCQGGAREA